MADPVAANTTVLLTEKQLAKLQREHLLWCAGALVAGIGIGFAVARFTAPKAAA
jgi:hypothetical protein